MLSTEKFIPNILICGDKAEFLSKVGNRPFNVVGEIKLIGSVDDVQFNFFKDGKFLLNNEFHQWQDLSAMLNNSAGGG